MRALTLVPPEQSSGGPLPDYRVRAEPDCRGAVARTDPGRAEGRGHQGSNSQPGIHRSMYSVLPDEGKRVQAFNPSKQSIVVDRQRPERQETCGLC